jgi:hypothetical protein
MELSWENVTVEGCTYRLRGEARSNQFPASMYMFTQVVIFTYNTSSKSEFEKLRDEYNELPTPVDGLIYCNAGKMPADRFPMLVVGCTFEGKYETYSGEREVFEQDVAKFIEEHPGCISGGECVVNGENDENVLEVFFKAAEIFHQLTATELPKTPQKSEQRTENMLGRRL